MRKFFVYFIVLIAVFHSHCATILTINNKAGDPHIYSGTRFNISSISLINHVNHPHQLFPNRLVGVLSMIDFPFSLILDTLALPYTIPRAIYYRMKQRKMEEEEE